MSAKIFPALEVIAGIAIDIYTGGSGGNYLIAAGLASEASILLSPKVPVPTRAPVQGTLRQTDAYANLVYGTQKMGGVLVYENTTGSKNETLDIVVAHAITDPAKGVDGFGSFYLNNHEIRVRPYEFWQAGHTYAVGDAIRDTNSNAQECVTGGVSGSAHPIWSTTKGALTYGSGTVVWKMVGGKASDITWDTTTTEQGVDGYVRPKTSSGYDYVHGTVTGGLFGGKVEVWAYTGSQSSYTQIDHTLEYSYGIDPVLPWLTTAMGKGIVWTHWRCTPGTNAADFEKAFGGTLPYSLEVVIRGEKIFDPRTSTTVYSENPALIARDFLTRDPLNGGCGVDASIIDDTNTTIPSANVCDQAVTMADGTSAPRFRASGVVKCGNKRRDEMQKILLSMAGYLTNRSTSVNNLAPVGIFSGSYSSPSGTIDDSFLRGSTTFSQVTQGSRYNSVRATFTDKYNDWQSMSAPPVPALSSTDFSNWVAEDGGYEIDKSLPLDFVPDSDHAQIVGGVIARQSRYLDSVMLQCNYKAIAFNVFDRVWLDNSELGISGDIYRITRMVKQPNWGIDVYLMPDDTTIWGSVVPQIGPIVPDSGETFTTTPDVSGLTAVGYSGGNKLTWSAPDAHRVKHIYIFYSSDGGTTYTQIDTVPGSAAQYLHPLANGLTGYYQIQFANDVATGTMSSAVNSTSGLAESGSTKGAKAGTNLLDSTGASLGDADVITSQGTASDVQVGAGKAVAQSGADKTSSNTAAAIAGQGALATKSNVDLATTDVLNKNTDNIAETANNLHWKQTQQTALLTNKGGENHITDPNITSADFWQVGTPDGAGGLALPTAAANTDAQGANLDGRGNRALIKVEAGDWVYGKLNIKSAATGTASGGFGLYCKDSLALTANTLKQVYIVGSAVGAVDAPPFQAPAGTVCVQVNPITEGGASGGTGPVIELPIVKVGAQTLTESGGAQLGSGLNLFGLNSAGYATAYWTGITLTPGPGSMAISAGTLHVGGETVSYNSSSISGQGYSTTYSYFYNDKGYAGGSQTLQATTTKQTLINNDGYIYIADGTTQSSGGTGGGGGIGSCLAFDMFIRPNVPAVMARVGQKFDAYDKFKALGERTLINAWTATGTAVRITTSNGSVLDCGEDTPFDLKDGTSKLAKDMLGETVITDGGEDTVASVTSIGVIPLMYVSGGGVTIMAGADPTKRVASHNTQKQ